MPKLMVGFSVNLIGIALCLGSASALGDHPEQAEACREKLGSEQTNDPNEAARFKPNPFAKNPYDVLDVKRPVDEGTLKAAYRYAAKWFHPDSTSGFGSAAAMSAITEAYDVLKKNLSWQNAPEGSPFGLGGEYGLNEMGVTRVYIDPFQQGPIVVQRTKYKLFNIPGTFFLDWNKAGQPAPPDYTRVVRATQYLNLSPDVAAALEGLLVLFAHQHQVGLQAAFQATVGVIDGERKDERNTPASYAAAQIFVSLYFGLYVQAVVDPANDHEYKLTINRLKEWKLLPTLASNAVVPVFIDRLRDVYDPHAFYQAVVWELIRMQKQKTDKFQLIQALADAAQIHAGKFGGEETHFLTLLLAFHNRSFAGQKLSHKTPEERTIIQTVVDMLKERLVPELDAKPAKAKTKAAKNQKKPAAVQISESASIDRFVSYFMILTVLSANVPAHPIIHNDLFNQMFPGQSLDMVSIPRKELFRLFKRFPALAGRIRSLIPEYSELVDEFAVKNARRANGANAFHLSTWNGSGR